MRLPLRLRLTLAFACGMAVVLSALGAFLYLRLGAELLASVDMGLRSRAETIVAGLGAGGSLAGDSTDLIDPDEAFAQVLSLSSSTTIVDSSSGVADAPLIGADELGSITRPVFVTRKTVGLEDPARLLVVPVERGDLFVAVGATLSDRQEALHRLLVLFAIGGPVALALTSMAGWFLAGAALRPVERMRQDAAAISASEPDRRLPVPPTGGELARLAVTLNAMLGRLQDALERERRFVDDASHELRTPLGILKAELDIAMSRSRSVEELEAALRRASADTDRLARLAEDLLVLSRAEGGRLPVHREGVSLEQLVHGACDAYRGTAEAAGVRMHVEVTPAKVHLDPVRVRQAIDDLLDNAVYASPAGGVIHVAARADHEVVRVSVEDSGPGFPPELLDRAFEPFARGVSTEASARTGAGLGLAIVRAVAEAHGGTATAENRPGGGARVTLELGT